jgi:hypothetical protein
MIAEIVIYYNSGEVSLFFSFGMQADLLDGGNAQAQIASGAVNCKWDGAFS